MTDQQLTLTYTCTHRHYTETLTTHTDRHYTHRQTDRQTDRHATVSYVRYTQLVTSDTIDTCRMTDVI